MKSTHSASQSAEITAPGMQGERKELHNVTKQFVCRAEVRAPTSSLYSSEATG